MRTLATVSIQWRAAVFSAFKPGGSCRPLSPPRRIYVPDTGFHTAFFVWPSHVTSTWLEAVVCCKVQVARMKERLFSSRMLEHSGLRIVDDNFGRNSAKKLQSVLVSGQEVLCRFAQGKLDIAQSAVAKHHDKEGEPSAS